MSSSGFNRRTLTLTLTLTRPRRAHPARARIAATSDAYNTSAPIPIAPRCAESRTINGKVVLLP